MSDSSQILMQARATLYHHQHQSKDHYTQYVGCRNGCNH
nr:MAG TPA: hypothetical protein [Caudoviricetes sp.]